MSSYYIPMPAAQMPRNALLDFSPIRQGIMDQRTMAALDYERQRQSMLDQRALENTQFEHGIQSQNLALQQAANARQERDALLPKLMQVGDRIMAFDPSNNYSKARTLYETPSMMNEILARSNNQQNLLSTRPQQTINQPDYGTPAIMQRPSSIGMTGTSEARPMNGISVLSPNQVTNTQDNTASSEPTYNWGGHDWTEQEIGLLKNGTAKEKATGEWLQKRLDAINKQNTFENKGQQAAAIGRLNDDAAKVIVPYRNMEGAYTNIMKVSSTYENPQSTPSDKAVSDKVLVANFINLMRPSSRSTVNANDQASIEYAGNLKNDFGAIWNSLWNGGTLTDQMRKSLIDKANDLFEEQSARFNEDLNPTRNTGRYLNIPEELFIPKGTFKTPKALEEYKKRKEETLRKTTPATANDLEIVEARPIKKQVEENIQQPQSSMADFAAGNPNSGLDWLTNLLGVTNGR